MRTTVSEKNDYYLSTHRMLELKHFCLQYPTWVDAKAHLYKAVKSNNFLDIVKQKHPDEDPVAKTYESIDSFDRKIRMVDYALKEIDEKIAPYILEAVTEGRSYYWIRLNLGVPCGRDEFYRLYRKFFFVLNKIRD